MRVAYHSSPNFNNRPAGARGIVSAIVLHATDDEGDPEGALSWVTSSLSAVSYHAIVERDGLIEMLVPPDKRAWHAGVSELDGVEEVNDFSLGLAFANRNDGVEPYTAAQLQAARELVSTWRAAFPHITPDRIVTHAAVALPPGRKTDPLGFDVPTFVEGV